MLGVGETKGGGTPYVNGFAILWGRIGTLLNPLIYYYYVVIHGSYLVK